MEDEYHKKLLEVIKKYNEEEYDSLINGDKVAVEEHLDALAEQFPDIESFEKSYQKTTMGEK